MANPAFTVIGSTYPVAASTTASPPFQFPTSGEQTFRVVNGSTTSICYIVVGPTAASVTSPVTPVANTAGTLYNVIAMIPGSVETFSCSDNAWFSVWLASGTGTVFLTPGVNS